MVALVKVNNALNLLRRATLDIRISRPTIWQMVEWQKKSSAFPLKGETDLGWVLLAWPIRNLFIDHNTLATTQ